MIPSESESDLTLQQLAAADALRLRESNISISISVEDQPEAEQFNSTMHATQIFKLRSSIYASLQSFIKPSMQVLIDGIRNQKPL